jgi:hypothetical protein
MWNSIFDAQNSVLNTRYLVLSTWYLELATPGTQYLVTSVIYEIWYAGFWALDFGTWHLVIRVIYKMLYTRYSILETCYLELGTQHSIFNIRNLTLGTRYLMVLTLDTWHSTFNIWNLIRNIGNNDKRKVAMTLNFLNKGCSPSQGECLGGSIDNCTFDIFHDFQYLALASMIQTSNI